MISLEKWKILTPLQKLPNKIILVTGFEWLPKVQKIAQSDHTVHELQQKSRQFAVSVDIGRQVQILPKA